jgi:hypothetical protein
VVDGQGQGHRGADRDLVTVHDGLADGFADGEDGGLRRVDDGGELTDAVHAEVADGEGDADEFVRGELACPCPGGEVARFAGDLGERLAVGVRVTGTMSPSSLATAMPTLTWRCWRMRVSSQETLISGWAYSAVAQARVSKSVTVILTSAPRRWLAWERKESRSFAAATTAR